MTKQMQEPESIDISFCDDCGEAIEPDEECWVPNLPRDVQSANEGESAVLCPFCWREL